jgi:serine protease Do
MSSLSELSTAIGRVSTTVGPSVVGIGRHLRGAGVVVAEGKVVTNAHNIRGDEVTVRFGSRAVVGRVAGIDTDGDLAVIAVDTAGAPPISWVDADGLTVGSGVFGVSVTPSGDARVTFGTVSAVSRAFRGPGGRRISGSVEHTAPLAPGSSGGPIVDADGRFLGLNTNRLGEGFYLALPADQALRDRVAALGRGESVERLRLGIAVAPAHVARRLRRSVGLPERDGLLVRGVEDGSPAARAGIAEGDLIVEVAGTAVTDADALVETIAATPFPFDVRIVRGTEERTLTVGGAAATGEA